MPTLKVINPANETVIRELEEDTAQTVAKKFARAKEGQKAWARRPLSERIAVMKKFRELVAERKEQLSQTMTSETGKPIAMARNELNAVTGRIDFFLNEAEGALRDEKVHGEQNLEERISHEPLGVIVNISAWNYPYFVGSNVFVPALLAGNAVLYKPSEFSSLTGLAIADMMKAAGVPEDAFIPVIGGGAIGAELLKHPIAGVFFTGSYATGRRIAEAVAGRMIKVQLELGGKDPIYVCEDAPVKAAAEGTADGAMYNVGQSCCSVERIYVHEKIHDAFVEEFLKAVRGFKVGDPTDDTTYIGPLTREPQLSVLEKQVLDARSKGAKLLTGGKRFTNDSWAKKGNWFEPTVFIDVNHSMELMREESFGPIIGIQKVKSDDEALRLMNETEYGLTAGIYTPDKARAQKLMAQLNSGSVYWNCCDRVSPRLPWSGRGHSGIGSTLGKIGIMTFTQPKAWHLRG